MNGTTPSLKYILGTVTLVVGITAYVILAITVPDTTARGAIIILVTPIASMLFTGAVLEQRMGSIESKTDTVVEQTNGKMTAHTERVATNAAVKAVALYEAKNHPKPRSGPRPRNITRGDS